MKSSDIHVGAWNGVSGAKTLLDLKAEFEQSSGIKVTYECLSEADLWTATAGDLENRTGKYDCFLTATDFLAAQAKMKQIESLEPFIKQHGDEKELAFDDILEKFRGMLKHEGAYYMLPLYGETSFLFYRTDLYEKYGLREPRNTDELWDNAKTIYEGEKGEVYGIVLRGKPGSGDNIYNWTPFLRAFGGKYFKDFPRDLTPTLDTDEAINSVKFYSELIKSFGPPSAADHSWGENIPLLQKGQAAQTLEATLLFGTVYKNQDSKYPENWKASLTPTAPGYRFEDVKPVDIFVCTWAINAIVSEERKAGSFRWIQWASSPSTMKEMCSREYLFRGGPPRRSILEHPALKDEKDVWIDAFVKSVEVADVNVRPKMKEWPEIGDSCGVHLQQAISGKMSPEAACKRMQETVTAIVKREGYPPWGKKLV